MKKFSEIEHFRHVVKTVNLYHERNGKTGQEPTMHYTGTVKLHGTNAGLRRTAKSHGATSKKPGKLQTQSRNNIIGLGNDNYGFAAFINDTPEEYLHELLDMVDPDHKKDVTLFGEWCGGGIQGGCGVNQLNVHWVLFGAWVDDKYVQINKSVKLKERGIHNILEIPQYHVVVDFKNPEDVIDELTKLTLEVEAECPWAKHFGMTGIGEGIVWTCDERPDDSDMWFKTKGEKHSGKSRSKKKVATIDPQKVENINQCVDIILTEGRLNQGFEHLAEKGLELEMKNMGKYLKWVGQDTMKEELDTVEANGLEWSDVSKIITSRAKAYFMERYNAF